MSGKTRNKGWKVKAVGNLPVIVVATEMESKHNNANSQYLPKLVTRDRMKSNSSQDEKKM